MYTPEIAPGARIVVRDAEWVVRRVDPTPTGRKALTVTGISQLVRDKEAVFLEDLEGDIEILDPAKTKLVPDTSSHYRNAVLYIESQLRRVTPTGDQIYIGHKAAMDPVPYQLDPALAALRQPRQRLLIADAVGLGKTLEAGILLSELIRRGRGKRILVVAVKSMLTQFQKEMWARFTIPLTRLDSIGIKRVRQRIPTNHNPFAYFDKSIISMDTLKQAEYKVHLEKSWWDIIVIDEAHNVAPRGGGKSMRSILSKLLAGRSDSLLMLSATPHDGSARSFAGLMNMLDPTAIADEDNYSKDEIKGLFIRRFKKDIKDQVRDAFKDRKIEPIATPATPLEEEAFRILAEATFSRLDRGARAGQLFKTTLEKALLSSPVACSSTLKNRIAKIEKRGDAADFQPDLDILNDLKRACDNISAQHFAKYQRLVQLIKKDMGWKKNNADDRLVIFTERIDTQTFLNQNLPAELGLKENQVEILHGAMSDVDQNRIVEEFGQENQKVRLLIASDVASEGINLHYLSHRMIHFDIPWSLMVFQQRNGRIDRYGQTEEPHIAYLLTHSDVPKIKSDTRILEVLIRKDEQANANIGDPRVLLGVFDQIKEEQRLGEVFEQGLGPEQFERELEQNAQNPKLNPLDLLLNQAAPSVLERRVAPTNSIPSLYDSHYQFIHAALQTLSPDGELQLEAVPGQQRLEFQSPDDLKDRFKYLPREIRPENDRFSLCADPAAIQEEIIRCRTDENAWPATQYLWEQHPVAEWVLDRLEVNFGRHEAPVLSLPRAMMKRGEDIFILSAMLPNRKAHPLLYHWFAVGFIDNDHAYTEDFGKGETLRRLGRDQWPNPNHKVDTQNLCDLLPQAIEKVEREMEEKRGDFERMDRLALENQLERLKELRGRQERLVRQRYANQPEAIHKANQDRKLREIEGIFSSFETWIRETRTVEEQPYIKVIAVLRAEER